MGKFSFDRDVVEELINFLEAAGTPTLAAPLPVTLPDPWGKMFIEVVVASQADFLATRNLKHFPEEAREGVRVVSPREFLEALIAG
jgi:predicted nucleic acid-binding protein